MKNKKPETISLGISQENLEKSAAILNGLLADESVLLFQTLNYHWNLVGPEFHDYHLLFDEQYKAIFGYIDEIAERVRALGQTALASMTGMLKTSSFKEDSSVPTPKNMILRLLERHEHIIINLRKGINLTAEKNNDMGTSNFLTDLLEKHEKIAWMLRSLSN